MDWRGIEDHDVKFKTLALFGGADIRRLIDQVKADDDHIIGNRYHQAVQTLNNYFIPRISIAFQLQKFRQAAPQPGENVEKFAFRLRKLAEHCELGDQAEKLVVNQIMSTTKDEKLKAKILKNDLPLDEVIAIARAHETLRCQLDQCGSSNVQDVSDEKILKIDTFNRKPNDAFENSPGNALKSYKQGRCRRCNGRHRFREDNCPAKDQKCRICGVVGHFARCCRQIKIKHAIRPANARGPSTREKRYIREIQDAAETEPEPEVFDLFHLNSKKRDVVVSIGGNMIKFIIDTGADVDVLCDRDWKILKQTGFMAYGIRKGSRKIFKAYGTNNHLKVLGEVDTEVTWKETRLEITLYVIEGGKCSLLSGDTAEKLGILKFVQAVENTVFPHMKGNI